ncbi:right-handed parallel beta-helix repeat-containing protein [bacterium]|nr:right-handed parallel beta-helix repeat-containing protein [bacterium]
MKLHRVTTIALCGLFLSVSGVWAGTFNVGAPTGVPATDQTNMQNALSAALASADPTNLVVFNSGGTYLMNDRLVVSGQNVKGVTFTSSGATPAIVVAALWTSGGNDLGAFHFDGNTGCKFGFSNLTLLPAPRSVVGATSAGVTNAVFVNPNNTNCDFSFEDVLVTANDGANAPVDTDGDANPQAFPNMTTWGVDGIRAGNPASGLYTGCNFYFVRTVISHLMSTATGGHGLLLQGATPNAIPNSAAETHWGKFYARDCIFSMHLNGGPFQIAGFADVDMRNCRLFATAVQVLTSQGDGFWVGQSWKVRIVDCTAEDVAYHGASIRTCSDVVLTRFTTRNNVRYSGVGIFNTASVVMTDCNITLDIPVTRSSAVTPSRCVWATYDAAPLPPDPRRFWAFNCTFTGGGYAVYSRGPLDSRVENCVFSGQTRTCYEDVTVTAPPIGSATLTIRDCTMFNAELGDLITAYTPDANPAECAYIYTKQDYVTIERVVMVGTSVVSASCAYGILVDVPIQAVVRDCYVADFNRTGVHMRNARPLSSGYSSSLLVENTTVVRCGVNQTPGLPAPPTALTDADNWYAPISLDQALSLSVRNCFVDTTKTDAVHLNMTGINYMNSTASIENVQFTGCRDNLIFVAGSDFNGNQLTVDGVTEISPNPANQHAGAAAIVVQSATATISNVTLTNRGGTGILNQYRSDTTQGLHVYRDIYMNTIGPDAIVVSQLYGGQMQISDTTIRNVTAGSGLSLRGGRNLVLSSVEVTDAARYGVSVGEDAITPSGAMSVTSMDDLCLYNNGLGGLRILQGDRTKGSMSLTNSTLLGSPAQLIYEPVATSYAQILWVTDTIIAGDNPGGIGISVPVVVAGGAAPAPPRVRVNTSALVEGGPWALATPTSVDAGNPAGTVLLVSQNIVNKDPGFSSTTPGDPDFLAVRSAQYGGKATGTGPGQTTDLDGCSYYIGDLAVPAWRLY